MTDFDADETVAPPNQAKRRKFWTSDRIIGYSGAALALTAAFFPWYVFFNSAKFGVDATVSLIARNFPGWADRTPFSPSPSSFQNKDAQAGEKGNQDQLLTGTVPGLSDTDMKSDPSAVEQPLPARETKFHLLHVSKGKALIEDDNGVYVVGPGSQLPDLSKVASVEERSGEWVIVTDKGLVYDANGKRN